jgi:hypothetical protein
MLHEALTGRNSKFETSGKARQLYLHTMNLELSVKFRFTRDL